MRVLALLMIAAALAVSGCASATAPPSPTAPARVSTAAAAAPEPGSIDAAVEEFVSRAQQNDVAYFRRVRGCETTESARFWIDRVNHAAMLKYYRSLLETGPGPADARLNFHSRGFFLVGLEKRNGAWRVHDIGP